MIVPAEIYDTLVRLGSHMRIDAKLLDVPTGEQILWRHHHEVTGIDLWTLLDEIARRMILR